MTEITPSETIVPCDTIEPVKMVNEERTFARQPDQNPFAAFNDWAHLEARRMAERGSCVTGTCRGEVAVDDWELVSEDGENFTCRFTAVFSCRCR